VRDQRQNSTQRQFNSSQAFHRTPGGRVRETTAGERFRPRILKLFDPAAQETYQYKLLQQFIHTNLRANKNHAGNTEHFTGCRNKETEELGTACLAANDGQHRVLSSCHHRTRLQMDFGRRLQFPDDQPLQTNRAEPQAVKESGAQISCTKNSRRTNALAMDVVLKITRVKRQNPSRAGNLGVPL
jgi:hypothetical protein